MTLFITNKAFNEIGVGLSRSTLKFKSYWTGRKLKPVCEKLSQLLGNHKIRKSNMIEDQQQEKYSTTVQVSNHCIEDDW